MKIVFYKEIYHLISINSQNRPMYITLFESICEKVAIFSSLYIRTFVVKLKIQYEIFKYYYTSNVLVYNTCSK